jgi:hypothetical protein
MTMRRRLAWTATLLTVCGGIGAAWALQSKPASKPPATDLGAFLREIMGFKFSGERLEIAIWCPYEFFIQTSQAKGVVITEKTEKELAILKDYVVIIAQAQDKDSFGEKVFSSAKELRDRAVLRLADGTEVTPVEEPPSQITVMLKAMKVAMSGE